MDLIVKGMVGVDQTRIGMGSDYSEKGFDAL